jgi:hypothetical protein
VWYGMLGLLSWALPVSTAQDPASVRGNRELAQRVAALEDKLAVVTFDATNNEVIITRANLRIVNGMGTTDTTNGLGNLIVGYNKKRTLPGAVNTRTGSHNVVVGKEHNFSSVEAVVVGNVSSQGWQVQWQLASYAAGGVVPYAR